MTRADAVASTVFGPEMVTAAAGTRITALRWPDANAGGEIRRKP
jgi:hypothetical protein